MTEVSVIDPSTRQPVPVGTYGMPLPDAQKKFIQEAGAMWATPSKITPVGPDKTIIVLPQSQPTQDVLKHFDKKGHFKDHKGDIPGAYELKEVGSSGKYTPTKP